MIFETAFSLASVVAMAGWLLLFASPWVPKWSDRIAGNVLPTALSLGYLILFAIPFDSSGGFGSLAGVMELFSREHAMLAGWIHYLAFDLFIGAWVCRKARQEGIRFVFVVPSLPLVFMLGPIGLLAFLGTRLVHRMVEQKARRV